MEVVDDGEPVAGEMLDAGPLDHLAEDLNDN
jgi:hypothetical protein